MSTNQSTYLDALDLNLAWISHGSRSSFPIIGLHGWLDNAASFDLIAPYLSEWNFCPVDLIGHGYSDHLPVAAPYLMLEFASHVVEFADAMGFEKFMLLGHSLGACVASLLAGTLTHRVAGLALIEGLGPLARDASEAAHHFQRYLERRRKKLSSKVPSYRTFDEAVDARVRGSKISRKGAEILAGRGLKSEGGELTWRTDVRLTLESPLRLTESQVQAFLMKISCPTLLISGDRGYEKELFGYGHRLDLVKGITHVRLPGDHHLHLDTPDPVGQALCEFYRNVAKNQEQSHDT